MNFKQSRIGVFKKLLIIGNATSIIGFLIFLTKIEWRDNLSANYNNYSRTVNENDTTVKELIVTTAETHQSQARNQEVPTTIPLPEINCLKSNGLHVLQEFFVLTSPTYHLKKDMHLKGNTSHVKKRQMEVDGSLQRNLLHPCTATITIFYDDDLVVEYINTKNFTNKEKLVLVKTAADPTMQTYLTYMNENLIGKTVITLHMDNVLSDGVDLIDTEYMERENVTYALSRTVTNSSCQRAADDYHCGNNGNYTQDAFVFSLKSPLPNVTFDILDFNAAMMGMENVMIYFFRVVMKYHVTNPCYTVKILHNHCSLLNHRQRLVDVKLYDGHIVPFSNAVKRELFLEEYLAQPTDQIYH